MSLTFIHADQWLPTSGRDPNYGRGVSDVGSREGFRENLIVIKKVYIQTELLRFASCMFCVFDIVPKNVGFDK